MSSRIHRVNQLIKEELGKILLREMDFGDALVTIIDVDTTPNLIQSRVKITVMPESQEQRALSSLNRNIYDLQQIFNKKVNMRPVPKIEFQVDKSAKKSYEIEKVMEEINNIQ